VPGTLSAGVKLPGHEADHSAPHRADVKNEWDYISAPPYVFIVRCLSKWRIRLHDVVLR